MNPKGGDIRSYIAIYQSSLDNQRGSYVPHIVTCLYIAIFIMNFLKAMYAAR